MKLPRRQFLHLAAGAAALPAARCDGTNLSDAAGALDRRLLPGGGLDLFARLIGQ